MAPLQLLPMALAPWIAGKATIVGMGREIRVLIVDEHELARRELAAQLCRSDAFALVAQAANEEEALRLAQEIEPQVVLLDPKMRRTDGIALCQRLRQATQPPQVLVLTSFWDAHEQMLCYRSGARRYLLKEIDVGPLLTLIYASVGENLTRNPA